MSSAARPPLALGGGICAADRIGNGSSVPNCNFGFNRSRGILIKAIRGEIPGNRMEDCWMPAIHVSPEYRWLEAGTSNDLPIAGNTITACHGVPIRIEAIGGNGDIAYGRRAPKDPNLRQYRHRLCDAGHSCDIDNRLGNGPQLFRRLDRFQNDSP
jgi:hypothetical protein